MQVCVTQSIDIKARSEAAQLLTVTSLLRLTRWTR